MEALLSLTNPVLKETLTLSERKADPQLSEAFSLLEQLTPGRLPTEVRDMLRNWAEVDETQQERFLAKVHEYSEALQFARSMAHRYTTGTVGCDASVKGHGHRPPSVTSKYTSKYARRGRHTPRQTSTFSVVSAAEDVALHFKGGWTERPTSYIGLPGTGIGE